MICIPKTENRANFVQAIAFMRSTRKRAAVPRSTEAPSAFRLAGCARTNSASMIASCTSGRARRSRTASCSTERESGASILTSIICLSIRSASTQRWRSGWSTRLSSAITF